MQARPAAGFTLLEILVALAVLAIGLSAAIRASSTSIGTVGELRDRQYAAWVADNRLAMLRALGDWPATGKLDGVSEMGRQQFVWQQVVQVADDARFRRIELNVSRDGRVLVRRLVFLMQP